MKYTRDNLDKLNKELSNKKKKLRISLNRMEKTQTRLEGATREILKKRFLFNIGRLHDEIVELKSSIAYSQRLYNKMKSIVEQKEQDEKDRQLRNWMMKLYCHPEPLTHRPMYDKMKELKLTS